MPANYVLLEKVTLGASAASVTFSNIPQSGYTDLKLVMSTRTDAPGDTYDNLKIYPKSLSTNLTSKYLGSYSGTTAFSGSSTAGVIANAATGATATANTFGNAEIYIPNYAGSTYKSMSIDAVAETNAADGRQGLTSFLWSSTDAITSLQILPSAGSIFVANSTFYLYGLAAVGTTPVIAPFASGGDVIENDGTYWIHTFLSSGTFTPAKALSCDYLVVAGGGGAGGGHGGGGGAGGYKTSIGGSPLSLSSTAYTVTVGAGGIGGYSYYSISDGANGTDSVFSTITSTAGGGGGGYNNNTGSLNNGKNGGSGGGGVGQRTSSGGTGTVGQGKDGGTGASTLGSGGGGGANVAGGNANVDDAGNGGNGLSSSITGTSVTYAGGGGGGTGLAGVPGTGGTGGGGAGNDAVNGNGTAGTANTGGGGGGAGGGGTGTQSGGNGGSGIIIIRYAMV